MVDDLLEMCGHQNMGTLQIPRDESLQNPNQKGYTFVYGRTSSEFVHQNQGGPLRRLQRLGGLKHVQLKP